MLTHKKGYTCKQKTSVTVASAIVCAATVSCNEGTFMKLSAVSEETLKTLKCLPIPLIYVNCLFLHF